VGSFFQRAEHKIQFGFVAQNRDFGISGSAKNVFSSPSANRFRCIFAKTLGSFRKKLLKPQN